MSTLLNIRDLKLDAILVRTDTGMVAMRDHASDLKPKLRAVLFLIDGRSTVGELLERAGTLHNILLEQLDELLRMEHIRAVDQFGANKRFDGAATRPVGSGSKPRAADLSPLMAAKMQLLNRLERLAGTEADYMGAELISAQTLGELAINAKLVSVALEPVVGAELSRLWWEDAKLILVAWRDMPRQDG
jgi:hypothetical protein